MSAPSPPHSHSGVCTRGPPFSGASAPMQASVHPRDRTRAGAGAVSPSTECPSPTLTPSRSCRGGGASFSRLSRPAVQPVARDSGVLGHGAWSRSSVTALGHGACEPDQARSGPGRADQALGHQIRVIRRGWSVALPGSCMWACAACASSELLAEARAARSGPARAGLAAPSAGPVPSGGFGRAARACPPLHPHCCRPLQAVTAWMTRTRWSPMRVGAVMVI
jgi:hypothetical protein